MKKALSIVLVLTLLLLSGANPAIALEIAGEDSVVQESTTPYSSDELFRIRAQLILDPNATQEDIDEIDAQLSSIGVEKISYAEVSQKPGNAVQPMYNVDSSSDTTWFSERRTVVIRGQQYEAQIITGQPENQDSSLYRSDAVVKEKTTSKPLGAVNALQVLTDSIVSYAADKYDSVIGDTYAAITTLYGMIKGYYEGASTSTVIKNAKYSFTVVTATTAKYVYVKYVGASDEGHQVLCYVGNHISYHINATIPTLVTTNGNPIAGTKTLTFNETATSYGYSNIDCIAIAAENYRQYKAGLTLTDVYFYIQKIPMVIFDTSYSAIITMNDPPVY